MEAEWMAIGPNIGIASEYGPATLPGPIRPNPEPRGFRVDPNSPTTPTPIEDEAKQSAEQTEQRLSCQRPTRGPILTSSL
eukprot:3224503-Pyramimonas_sp.AAC.1